MSIDEYLPEDEGHHCDGSGLGPADTWIPRSGHQWIHQDVAAACKKLGEKTKGFCGDPTTLKIGNPYFQDSSEDSPIDIIFPKKHTSKPYSLLSTLQKSEESTVFEYKPFLPIPLHEETPQPDILPLKGMHNQNHWLGMDCSQENPWSLTSTFKAPVLEPVDITKDPSYIAYQTGKNILDKILERQEKERIDFERTNPGIADFENAIYKRNMLEPASIPRLDAMPLPRGLLPFRW